VPFFSPPLCPNLSLLYRQLDRFFPYPPFLRSLDHFFPIQCRLLFSRRFLSAAAEPPFSSLPLMFALIRSPKTGFSFILVQGACFLFFLLPHRLFLFPRCLFLICRLANRMFSSLFPAPSLPSRSFFSGERVRTRLGRCCGDTPPLIFRPKTPTFMRDLGFYALVLRISHATVWFPFFLCRPLCSDGVMFWIPDLSPNGLFLKSNLQAFSLFCTSCDRFKLITFQCSFPPMVQ